MSKTNKQIFEDFNEMIGNQHRFDLFHEYISDQFIFHTPPYVGLGFGWDDSSGNQILVNMIGVNTPAAEQLQLGDEVVRMIDENGSPEGYEQLKNYPGGPGKLGKKVGLTILREGKTIDLELERRLIEAFDPDLAPKDLTDLWSNNWAKNWPDMQIKIDLMVEEGELLAYFITSHGINAEFNQPAVWAECGVIRIRESKICEWWSVEDTLSLFKQLGYLIREPVKEPV